MSALDLLRLWFGLSEPVSRRAYALSGFGLMALKYVTETALVHHVTGRWLTPLDYFNPLLTSRLAAIGGPGLLSAALIVWTLYAWLLDGTLADERALIFLALLAPVYIGGVFLFSYGYELYDIPKTIRLTAIIVFITLAAVLIVAVLFALLGDSKSGSSSSSSSRAGSSGSGSSFSLGGSSSGSSGGSLNLNFGSSAGKQVVIQQVAAGAPVVPPPVPVTCPFCGRPYLAATNNFACPNCGAATPDNLRTPETT